jgi:sialidase-1
MSFKTFLGKAKNTPQTNRRIISFAVGRLAFLLCLCAVAQQPTRPYGAENFTSTILWTGGVGGYATYRIPGIVSTKRGVLLAYSSARMGTSDWADIDIVMRRSIDRGNTWSASRRIAGETQGTTDNPVAIPDYQTGAVHFLFQHNYERAFYMRSDDDGKTFSKPIDITAVFEKFRSEYDWRVIAPGVGHALQLRNGRLLVPLWMSTGAPTGPNSRAHRPSAVATIYSDDHGKTWERGAIIVNSSDEIPNPSESMAVQLADGRILLSIRNESTKNRRVFSISPDGATNWSKPEFDQGLFEPICAASIVRFGTSPADPDPRILFSNPDSAKLPVANPKRANRPRQMLTIKLSADNAKSWTQHRILDPGVAGYSDLAVDREKNIYVLYEEGAIRGSETNNTHTILAKFPIDWLMKAVEGQ